MERTNTHISQRDIETIVAALRGEPDGESLARRFRDAIGPQAAPRAQRALDVRLLGEFAIRVGDRWEPGPPPMRGRYLIQYLAVHRTGVVPRERLAEALWPELDGESATHRVHIAVSGARAYLRHALGGIDAIRCVRSGYAWSAGITVATDVDAFLEAARGESREELLRAKELYGGELLASDSAEWIEPLRVRCASAYVGVLERLADHAVSYGEYGQALGFGLELIAFDRGHEGASRLVMRCFAALGRRGRALAEYEALRAHLRKHLGLEPAAETRQLVRTIVGQSEPDAIPQKPAAFKA
jgi:LuxR family transcriptional regulator, maltose regulon positive regulatory protein